MTIRRLAVLLQTSLPNPLQNFKDTHVSKTEAAFSQR